MSDIPVHPMADIFPMMTEDELADLAADIKANGLLHPIVLDEDGVLIDGRNRLRACLLAGIVPQYTQLNGHDAAAFIVSANLARRNLTKGQQAMALAMIYPEPHSAPRGKCLETQQFDRSRLSQARSVRRHSRALAVDVVQGRKSLDAALKQVAEEQEASASVDTQLAELRHAAPDLADLVAEERLELSEAYAAMKQRIADAEAAEANKRETMLRLSERAWQATTGWASETFVADVTERLADESFRRSLLERTRVEPERLAEMVRGAEAFVALFSQLTKGEGNV